MKTALKTSACMLAMALVASGCTASEGNRSAARSIAAEQFVALNIVAPAPQWRPEARGYRLGAGDSLGQAVYENYATVVRADPTWQYASGESTR